MLDQGSLHGRDVGLRQHPDSLHDRREKIATEQSGYEKRQAHRPSIHRYVFHTSELLSRTALGFPRRSSPLR